MEPLTKEQLTQFFDDHLNEAGAIRIKGNVYIPCQVLKAIDPKEYKRCYKAYVGDLLGLGIITVDDNNNYWRA